jgi:Skp family chaperone for outer membrane proteins
MADKKSFGAFEVVYIVMLGALLLLAVFHMGKPRVGVIDLAAVARELGVDDQIEKEILDWRETAVSDLKGLKNEYTALGKGIKEQALTTESDEAKTELKQEFLDASRDYSRQTMEVRQRMQRHQQELLQTFRGRLDPFIMEVARKKHLWVVLDRSARMVYATSRVDISAEVVKNATSFFEQQTDLLDPDLISVDLVDEPEPPAVPAE